MHWFLYHDELNRKIFVQQPAKENLVTHQIKGFRSIKKTCINSMSLMHIARDVILNSARTKGGGHLLKTKLKAGGSKMIRIGL